jgi:hypothetical protein
MSLAARHSGKVSRVELRRVEMPKVDFISFLLIKKIGLMASTEQGSSGPLAARLT